MLTPDRLVVRVRYDHVALAVARDGGEWQALAGALTELRAHPMLAGLGSTVVYPKAGVPYRDVIRAYEIAGLGSSASRRFATDDPGAAALAAWLAARSPVPADPDHLRLVVVDVDAGVSEAARARVREALVAAGMLPTLPGGWQPR